MIQKMQRRNIPNEFSPQVNKLFFWYAFLMAFPSLIIFQNISVYIFLIILFFLTKSGYSNFGFSKNIQRFALLFALAAVASTIGGYLIKGNSYLMRSLQVLPNYIYWSFLIIFLVHHRNRLNFNSLFKGLTIGLVISLPYYFYFQFTPSMGALMILKSFSQNSFAFLIICFSPISIFYLKSKYGKITAIFFIIIFSLAGLLSGSRSGSILVFAGSFLAFFLTGQINIWRSLLTVTAGIAIFVVLSTDFGKNLVKSLNPRTHELVYSTQSTFETDRSYLTRRALVDKGIDLFNKYPITGVGLNNFAATVGKIEGDFEGAEFVIHKGIEHGKSAHNSYISILSEGGLVLTIPFLLILLTLLVHFFHKFRSMPDFYRPVFIGVLMMAVHLYFISAILNVFGWFLLGMAASLVYREKEKDMALQQTSSAKLKQKKHWSN